MLSEIVRFEIRYHLKGLVFYVCLVLFFLLAFGAVTSESVTIGGSLGNVHRNAPFVIMQFLLIMSIFGVFTTTAFVSNAALRDFDLGTDSLFFSSPIRRRDYLIGRFAGSLAVSFLVFLGVVLGIMIGSKMPWLESERIGAFHLWPYAWSMFVLIAPTLLLVGGLFFCVAVLTRSTMATYASAVGLFAGYFVASAVAGNSLENEKLFSLFDPFALSSFGIATRYWTVFERNNHVLPLEGVFLWNRVLWAAIGIAIFAFTLWKFRFEVGSRKSRNSKKAAEVLEGAPVSAPASSVAVTQHPAWVTQFLSTTKLELAMVLKSVAFIVILVLGVVNTIGNAAFSDALFDTKVYPVTEVMVNAIDGGFLLFAFIIITFYAGEIVFRERQAKLAEVADATPVPNSAVWSGKLAALYIIVVMLMTVAMLATIGVQTAKGYYNYELAVYGKRLFLELGVPLLMVATLAFFLHVITNNKYIGFLGILLYIISIPVLPSLGYEHNLYRFAQTPRTPYSDMNGYGHFVKPLVLFNLYWAIFCGLIVVAAHLLWVRGTESAFGKRLSIARQRVHARVVVTAALFFAAFAATGSYIYYNTNVLNHYRTTKDNEQRQAEAEKKYKKYEFLPQPKITDVQANVDIYPEKRTVSINGTYTLVNKTSAPLTEMHVTTNPDAQATVTIPSATVKTADKDFGYTIYKLDPPLQPGATLPLKFSVNVTHRGFVNGADSNDIVGNGTFINNFAYFPNIGYAGFTELQDRSKRKKYGLPPVTRLPKIDDARARNYNEITGESDFINLDTTVSTSPDQIALAPGYLQKEWTANGRRYFHYKTTSPILGFWSYLSARYAVKRDHWRDVALEVYYDPKHPYNVDRMIYGMKKSLDYYSANFSPYQHKQVRIIEFPRYARFAQSFPNTIPFSESIGFIADLRDKNAIDYVFYVTAHEVGHQWWAHQVVGANVQGTTMITETLAQYSALMVMEHEYGRDLMHRFLKHELNRYLQGRGGELVAEMPLQLVENQPYIHYGKGSLAMYELKDAIGEQNVNAALRATIGGWAFQGPPYVRTVELLNNFGAVTPPANKGVIDDLFETITLYDNKTTEVTSTKRADGKYDVKFTVESKKLRADGSGNEKPVAIDDWIDVGVLAAGPTRKSDDKVLALEKRHITAPKTTFEFVVSEKPSKAGIDPLNKLIDRNPDDNVKKISM